MNKPETPAILGLDIADLLGASLSDENEVPKINNSAPKTPSILIPTADIGVIDFDDNEIFHPLEHCGDPIYCDKYTYYKDPFVNGYWVDQKAFLEMFNLKTSDPILKQATSASPPFEPGEKDQLFYLVSEKDIYFSSLQPILKIEGNSNFTLPDKQDVNKLPAFYLKILAQYIRKSQRLIDNELKSRFSIL